MEKEAKIYVAGHRGLVGSAIVKKLRSEGYENIILKTHEELDLTDQERVYEFFWHNQPDYVFLCAARVGGIHANSTYPADFIFSNIQIQTNIIDMAYTFKTRKLLFMGSSCIYPKYAPQPMREEYLLSGPLEPTNAAYAIAKISGIIMCQSYNRQYPNGCRYISVMPTNLYGDNDNYHAMNSHVLPALIRRFYEAKMREDSKVAIWGSGLATREFLYSDDLADACVFLMRNYSDNEIVNIGYGEEISIRDLAALIKDTVGFKGILEFDKSMPDGTPRKLVDSSKLMGLGWKPSIPLEAGLKLTYANFLKLVEEGNCRL